MIYLGANDAPQLTVDYYDRLVETLGRGSVEDFVRLFVIPEMGDCGGGPVPDFATRLWPRPDEANSMFAALERWVETGVAPGSVTGDEVQDRRRPGERRRAKPPSLRVPAGSAMAGSRQPGFGSQLPLRQSELAGLVNRLSVRTSARHAAPPRRAP